MTEAAFVTVCCYFCECMWTAVFFQKHSLVAKIFLLHTCFQPPWVLAIVWCLALRVCVCVCLLQMKKIAKMKGPGLGLVCCRLCVMSFARCRMKLPPPLLTPTFPLWPCCSGREGRSGEEWPRCNQQTLWAPSWVPASCLYACLIGQKQHGWLCSQGTDIKDLAYPHMSYVLVIFFRFRKRCHWLCSSSLHLGYVCPRACLLPELCQPSPSLHHQRVGVLLSLQIGLSALLLLCCDMVSAYFQDGWIMLSSIWPTI